MVCLALSYIYSAVLEPIHSGRLSDKDKALEIMILRRQLDILEQDDSPRHFSGGRAPHGSCRQEDQFQSLKCCPSRLLGLTSDRVYQLVPIKQTETSFLV